MKQYLRCKACGYIMEASKLGDVCPACGVPSKAFEPYEEKISEGRKRMLDMHMHPIVVHLAQAIVPMLLALSAALLVLGEGRLKTALLHTTLVLASFLPFTVLMAFAAGLFDGKLRFRKVTTPLLLRKIVVGSVFFAASVGGAALAFFAGLHAPAIIAAFGFIQVVSLGAAVILGYSGFGLLSSKLPG